METAVTHWNAWRCQAVDINEWSGKDIILGSWENCGKVDSELVCELWWVFKNSGGEGELDEGGQK